MFRFVDLITNMKHSEYYVVKLLLYELFDFTIKVIQLREMKSLP